MSDQQDGVILILEAKFLLILSADLSRAAGNNTEEDRSINKNIEF